MSEPLVHHASFWCCAPGDEVRGVSVRFEGARTPMVSVAGDDDSCRGLLAVCADFGPATLVTHEAQWLPTSVAATPSTRQRWLVARCKRSPPSPQSCRIGDADELALFQARYGTPHWHPEMLQFGHCFGVRDRAGELVSVGGVTFCLPTQAYAQIGGLLTAKPARGQGYAGILVESIISSLADAGILHCGMLVDEEDRAAIEFCAKRGFASRSRFRVGVIG
jgi:GNAT superfamily N-acetyltransferase